MPNYAKIFVQNFRYYTGPILAVQPISGGIGCLGLSVKQRQRKANSCMGVELGSPKV